MDKKIIIKIINDMFHDESLNVVNAKNILEVYLTKSTNKDEQILIIQLITALNERYKIANIVTPIFYNFRSMLEKALNETS